MKLLAIPKAEVDIIPNDPAKEPRSFTYYIGDPYPSQPMGEYISLLDRECKIVRKVFSPLFELTQAEFQALQEETERFRSVSGDLTIFPKEDIVIDNYKFNGCFLKSSSRTDEGNYSCEFYFVSIEKLD